MEEGSEDSDFGAQRAGGRREGGMGRGVEVKKKKKGMDRTEMTVLVGGVSICSGVGGLCLTALRYGEFSVSRDLAGEFSFRTLKFYIFYFATMKFA